VAHSAVTSVKTAEPIVMPFGLWTWTDPGNRELDGGPDAPMISGSFGTNNNNNNNNQRQCL